MTDGSGSLFLTSTTTSLLGTASTSRSSKAKDDDPNAETVALVFWLIISLCLTVFFRVH